MDSPIIDEHTFSKYITASLKYIKEGELLSKLAFDAQNNDTKEVFHALEESQHIAASKLKEMVVRYIEEKNLKGMAPELSSFLMIELYNTMI